MAYVFQCVSKPHNTVVLSGQADPSDPINLSGGTFVVSGDINATIPLDANGNFAGYTITGVPNQHLGVLGNGAPWFTAQARSSTSASVMATLANASTPGGPVILTSSVQGSCIIDLPVVISAGAAAEYYSKQRFPPFPGAGALNGGWKICWTVDVGVAHTISFTTSIGGSADAGSTGGFPAPDGSEVGQVASSNVPAGDPTGASSLTLTVTDTWGLAHTFSGSIRNHGASPVLTMP